MPNVYHDCGQFYYFRVDRFQENKNILKGHIVPFFVDEMEVQDIDNEMDWRLAELKFRITKEINL